MLFNLKEIGIQMNRLYRVWDGQSKEWIKDGEGVLKWNDVSKALICAKNLQLEHGRKGFYASAIPERIEKVIYDRHRTQ